MNGIIQRIKRDLPCGYLDISVTYFHKFLGDYNSGIYGNVSLSYAHLYKAYDALYQSMLLLAGVDIRRNSDNQNPAGKVTGLTESFINPLLSLHERPANQTMREKLQIEKWLIPSFKAIALKEGIPKDYAFFASLNFLRGLRNASEHDFLEIGGGSYNSLITISNTYLIPLARIYLEIYREYHTIVISNCRSKDIRYHDRGRASNCSLNNLRIQLPKEIEKVTHFPFPIHVAIESPEDKKASVSILLHYLTSISIDPVPLLKDEDWFIQNADGQITEAYLNDNFLYRSIAEVSQHAGIPKKDVEKIMTKHRLKSNQEYVLHLKSDKGTTSIIYSRKLVTFLRGYLSA